MRKHLKYARYIILHKLYVGQECFKRGLYLRGIIHDWDKLLPGRWRDYSNFFYGSIGDPSPEFKEAFAKSWRRHAYLNDHHWQHWCSIHDNGEVRAHEMSEIARIEMLCDWIGAHKAVGGSDLYGWFQQRADTILIAPKTKRWMRQELIKLYQEKKSA